MKGPVVRHTAARRAAASAASNNSKRARGPGGTLRDLRIRATGALVDLRHIVIAAIALLCVACAPSSQPHGSTATADSGDTTALVAKLTAQSDAWDEAIVRKDRAAIEANMAEDFRQIDRQANIETKASFVAGLMDSGLTIDPYAVEDFDVRLYGDTALLSGRTRMTGTYQGKPFASHYRYIDVYARRGGEWKIVSVQITSMPADSP